MDDKQKSWLGQIVGKQVLRAELNAIGDRKDAVRSKVAGDVEAIRDRLFNNLNLKMSNGREQQNLLNYGVRDQRLEFDLDDQQDGFALMSDADAAKFNEGHRMVDGMSRQFDEQIEVIKRDKDGNAELDDTNEPIKEMRRLFDEKELSAEFYQPLLRQGLIPETFVPNSHSETESLMKGSFEAYAERLKTDFEASDIKRFLSENKDLMISAVTSGLAFASQGIKSEKMTSENFNLENEVGDFNDRMAFGNSLLKAETDETTEMVGLGWDFMIDDAMEGTADIGDAREPEAAKSKRPVDLKRAAEFITAAVAAELGQGLSPWKLQITASAAYSSVVHRAEIAAGLAGDIPRAGDADMAPSAQQVLRAGQACCAGFVEVFKVCDPQSGTSTAVMGQAAQTIQVAFMNALDTATVIAAMTPGSENYAAVIAAFRAAATAGVRAGTSEPTLDALLTASEAAIGTKLTEKITADFVTDANADSMAAQRELAALANAKDDAQSASGLLERKIAVLNRDQLLLKWSANIAGMGIEAASKFFAPMAIAGSLLKLSVNIGKAAARTRDFHAFVESNKGICNAASAFSAPVDNFIHNADIQRQHYTINAALELVIMIGAIVETVGLATGLGAAVGVVTGKAMQAGGAMGQGLEAILYEISKRVAVEQGWKLYRNALLRPANRKLALMAMAGNPTLAKYSIAWGAVVLKDPLVADFLGECGLDAATLADPSSSLDKVHKYLEARMPDDSKLVGRMPLAQDWEPAVIVLTSVCWTSVVRRAEKSADLLTSDARPVELALSNFEESFQSLSAAHAAGKTDVTKKPTADAVTAGQAQLTAVDAALKAYKPKRTVSGEPAPHQQMMGVVKKFVAQALAARSQLKAMAA